MNKTKKIVTAVVSIVMAGTIATSFAACGNSGGGNNGNKNVITPSLDNDGNLSYTEGIEIKTSLGYNSTGTGITYTDDLIKELGDTNASSVVVAGHRYVSGDLKPAWRQLSSTLGITIKDDWVNKGAQSASNNIAEIKKADGLASYGLITASGATIVEEATNDTLLNITDYLDYMPNYKAFLESNTVTRLSLTADTATGAMYMLPYYDGNNDVEKYVLIRKDIVEKLLDTTDVSSATGTFASQAATKNKADTKGVATIDGTKASVESFMGTTASDNYTIAVTDPSVMTGDVVYGTNQSQVSDATATVNVVLDYGKVIDNLKDANSDLYQAVAAALPSGTTVQVVSGNIVDIQNQIINATSGACTGAQLLRVLQEYIKVAYHKENSNDAFYTKLSDVFNSAYAAWDVDLYVALGRAAVCSGGLLGGSARGEDSYFVGSRTGYTNRTYDAASLAGELYGVRGLTTRYANLFTYINSKGEIVDARSNEKTWTALANMNALAKEGLYYTGVAAKDGYGSIANTTTNTGVQFFSSYDYVQTQTKTGGFAAMGTTNTAVEAGYNYAPILTPVSRWDTDDNGTHETVMRFTESWRGVKDGGMAIPKDYVKDNPERLSAILALVDWMYSNDGQIVMTYGPFSSAGNITAAQGATTNESYGTWYATKVRNVSAADTTNGIVATYDGEMYYVTAEYQSQYFCFENVLYTGTFYNGRQIPTMTDENISIFTSAAACNFTNHARKYLGTALNLGNKDQGFEYQCTPTCGLVGADIWAIANVNGTIKHVLQTIDSNNYWYTQDTTLLPFSTRQLESMSDNYGRVSGYGGTGENFFYANSKATSNLLTDIMYYGFDSSKEITTVSPNIAIPTSAAGVVELLNGAGLSTVDNYITSAWNNLLSYYNSL